MLRRYTLDSTIEQQKQHNEKQSVKSIDVKLYQYVDDSTIIGLAVYNDRNKKYEFMLIIKEEHRCYSFYDKAN